MKQIKDFIWRIKFINLINEIVLNSYYAILFMIVVTDMIIMGSKFVPIIFIKTKLIVIYLSFVLAMPVYSFVKNRNKWKQSLFDLDDKQRIITAFERQDMNDEITKMQRKDAIEYVECIELKKQIPIVYWHKRQFTMILISVITFIVLLLLPSFHGKSIQKIEFAEKTKREIISQIDEDKEIIQDTNLEKVFKDEILEALKSSKRELKEYNAKQNAEKALEKQKENLEDLIKKSQEALKKQTEGIKEQTNLLEEILDSKDMESLKSLLEEYELDENLLKYLENLAQMQSDFKEILKNIDKEMLENLMQSLKNDIENSSCNNTDAQNSQGGT